MTRPSKIGRDGIFFVPQRPYITPGTLREQILYPHEVHQQMEPDRRLREIMDSVGLGYLVQKWGFDVRMDWADMLSGGEQQRLGFARVFYHRPAFAVMDESTSALDLALEARCLQGCRDANISMINVAHRPSVIPFHEFALTYDGDARFVVSALGAKKLN